MELYNVNTMPRSKNPERRAAEDKILRGETLTLKESMAFGGRDHVIRKIGSYECKPDHCYRCIPEDLYEIYKEKGYVFSTSKEDFQESINNEGIDWYLGGACPRKRYGNIILECPADKNYFVPANDNGCGMADDVHVRHMKSSPKRNPIPMSMITNVFDYHKVLERERMLQEESQSEETPKVK